MPQLPKGLPKRGRSESLSRQKSKKFYHTTEWRKLRRDKKKRDRLSDESEMMSVYKQSKKNKPFHLNQFLESDMPMCRSCKEDGLLRVSYYLDHIKRIRDGGHKKDENNLQWLCVQCDRDKRVKESYEK